MSTVRFRPPQEIGAANVQIFSPTGAPVANSELVTYSAPFEFEAREQGLFYARVTPVGEDAQFLTFYVGSRADVSGVPPGPAGGVEIQDNRHPTYWSYEPKNSGVDVVWVGPGQAGRAEIQDSRHLTYWNYTPKIGSLREATTNFQWDTESAPGWRNLGRRGPGTNRPRRISAGLSYDSLPNKFGGWRPFTGPWPLAVFKSDNRWWFELGRSGDEPMNEENGRLRLHISIEESRAQRLLIPVFLGGVSGTIDTSGPEIKVSLRARDENIQLLLQGLSSASGPESDALLDIAAKSRSNSVNDDPWASLAFGLLAQQRHPDAFSVSEAQLLEQEFAWIPDTSIILANLLLRGQSPDVGSALNHLEKARRVGAPYFVMTNSLHGDLLVTLAADAPLDEHRKRAASELAIWRRRIPFQMAVGPFFSWLTRKGWQSDGKLDRRYVRPLFSGTYVPDPSFAPVTNDPFDGMESSGLDASAAED
jgi:hypothetical protein